MPEQAASSETGPGAEEELPLVVIQYHPETGPTREVLALVDSGATRTVLPPGTIGLDWETLEPSGVPLVGLGGKVDMRLAPGNLSYSGVTFCRQILIAPPDALGRAVLGRADFFQSFDVTLRLNRRPIEFEAELPQPGIVVPAPEAAAGGTGKE